MSPVRVVSRRPAKRSRADWYAEVIALSDSGMTGTAIAARLGLSSTFVYALLNDPDGSKDKARKAVYQGVCVDCGGATSGAEGRGAYERCATCSHVHQAELLRVWTRESVIDAIQRFAREHGRPPRATDWLTENHGSGYPWAASVYRNKSHPNAPFGYWADAIEAAGFPRPLVGHYDRSRA